jgi:release factor glutamine methyltransferase
LKTPPPIKTFQYNGLTIELHPEVYEPAEDTFQLLEAASVKKGDKILEIGTGCGLISLDCARSGAQVVCTDINPYAVKLALRNCVRNRSMLMGSMEVRLGDLFSAVKTNEVFDIVIFNPPYLPTCPEEKIGGTGWFDVATDGGVDGLTATKRFIDGIHKHLHKHGHAYFVFSSLADRTKLDTYLSDARLHGKIVLSRWFDDEQIDIYCISLER